MTVVQGQVNPQQKVVQQQTIQPAPVQYAAPPQIQPQAPQNVQVPNYSGVNIQIFNPSVAAPGGGSPVYNVNAPTYSSGTQNPQAYPQNYYTQQFGPGQNANNANTNVNTTNTTTTTTTEEKKKTEKRKIVQLTDDYIKTLENYLNSQDKEVRLMGAKEVAARLQEDESRKDDKALNALVNKMLQDPYQNVRIMALALLETRAATGDEFSVQVLKAMQNSKSGYGQDAVQATNILLKMAGQTVEKEFEVKDKPKTEEKKA